MEAATQAGQVVAAVTATVWSRRRRQRASSSAETVRVIYRRLSRSWGPQHWWPAQTPFEVVAGAILTQNTSWTNVERALANLRAAGRLSTSGIRSISLEELQELLRPGGYFRQKSQRLKDFVRFLDERFAGSVETMLSQPAVVLREQLLAQKGIGPETADSILLYAGHQAVFVVDAYTRRVLERHDVINADATYDDIRQLVEYALATASPPTLGILDPHRPEVHAPSAMSTAAKSALAQIYNEMHGLFVQLGKHYCVKRNPKCESCPLGNLLQQPVSLEPLRQIKRKAKWSRGTVPKKAGKSRL